MRQVACPVLVAGGKVLMFRHPLAGYQLVKGAIESGETPAQAATRELLEEAGLDARGNDVAAVVEIGGQPWHFVPMRAEGPVAGTWVHHCTDDGGHDFAFFWHPLDEEPPLPCHAAFVTALGIIRTLT